MIRITLVLLLVLTAALAQGRRPRASPDPRALGELGGEGIPLPEEEARAAGVNPKAAAIEVVSVIPGGAGAEAGLASGDIIIGIAKKSLGDTKTPFIRLTELLEKPRKAGTPVEVRVRRAGKTLKQPTVPFRPDSAD